MDFRNSRYCPPWKNIPTSKSKLKEIIIVEHPRAWNFYTYVSSSESYKKQFSKLYNYKCSYCGCSMDIIAFDLFEIDHFINEASFKENGEWKSINAKKEAHSIENLVFSCKTCNRGKTGITVPDEYITLLHPDNGSIQNIFFRDSSYQINIQENYKNDCFINYFYKSLKLEYQFRRLDYLLMSMKGLIKYFRERDDAVLSGKLCDIYERLKNKRHYMTCRDTN